MKISNEELQQAFEEARGKELDQLQKAYGDEEMNCLIESSMANMNPEKIYRKAQGFKKHRFSRWSGIVAAFLLTFAMGSASAIAIIHKAGVEWKTTWGETEAPEQIRRRYKLSYLPEGYWENGENQQSKTYSVTYTKDKSNIYYRQIIKTAETIAAGKLKEEKSVDIHGYKGQMGYQGDKKSIKFVTEQYVFWLAAEKLVEWDELRRMAESISKMEPDIIETYFEPVYLPMGYKKTGGVSIDEAMKYIYYSNGEGDITFGQSTFEGSISIDSEGMKRETVDINGWEGQLNYKGNKKELVWVSNEYVFSIFANGKTSREELLKIAENVAPVE